MLIETGASSCYRRTLLRLAEIFREHAPAQTVVPPALDETLTALWSEGQTAWPGIRVDAGDFVAYLAQRLGNEPVESWLSGAHAADLYLCCACSAGSPAALAAFDERYLSQVGGFVARMRVSPAFIEELTQTLRERLFVGSAPKIGEYSGRGGLHNWLRVVSVRTALNLLRGRHELLDDGAHSHDKQLPSAQADPELAHIKQRYTRQLAEAMNAGFAQLSSEQRQLLRSHFLEGVTLDQLATRLAVHRATVARRIADARQGVLHAAKQFLRERLQVGSTEVDSLMGLVRSGLDLSISRLLKSARP
jgi:RNA polymerase sigma-70 factor (ECF subfamily)